MALLQDGSSSRSTSQTRSTQLFFDAHQTVKMQTCSKAWAWYPHSPPLYPTNSRERKSRSTLVSYNQLPPPQSTSGPAIIRYVVASFVNTIYRCTAHVRLLGRSNHEEYEMEEPGDDSDHEQDSEDSAEPVHPLLRAIRRKGFVTAQVHPGQHGRNPETKRQEEYFAKKPDERYEVWK